MKFLGTIFYVFISVTRFECIKSISTYLSVPCKGLRIKINTAIIANICRTFIN